MLEVNQVRSKMHKNKSFQILQNCNESTIMQQSGCKKSQPVHSIDRLCCKGRKPVDRSILLLLKSIVLKECMAWVLKMWKRFWG